MGKVFWIGEKMRFNPPMKQGNLDMEQLGTLKQEIAQDILKMQQGGGITEEQAQRITTGKIERCIIDNMPMENIKTTEDVAKFLIDWQTSYNKVIQETVKNVLISY